MGIKLTNEKYEFQHLNKELYTLKRGLSGLMLGEKMCSVKLVMWIGFWGYCCTQQVTEIRAMSSGKNELQELTTMKTTAHTKQIPQPQRVITIHKSITKPKLKTTIQSKRQIQRRDVPFQQQFFDNSPELENLQANKPEIAPINQYTFISKVPALKPLGKLNETEAERAERIHKSFERLLTFVEIVGQVDNYVSSKWKNLVRTVSNFYEVEDEPYRVSAKRIYGPCQNAL